eukprot:5409022-Amphidinium_carterae.1
MCIRDRESESEQAERVAKGGVTCRKQVRRGTQERNKILQYDGQASCRWYGGWNGVTSSTVGSEDAKLGKRPDKRGYEHRRQAQGRCTTLHARTRQAKVAACKRGNQRQAQDDDRTQEVALT